MHTHIKAKLDEFLADFSKNQSKLLMFMDNMKMSYDMETIAIRQQKDKIGFLTTEYNKRLAEEQGYLAQMEDEHDKSKADLDYANDQLGIKTKPTKKVVLCGFCGRKFDELKGKACPHCGKDNTLVSPPPAVTKVITPPPSEAEADEAAELEKKLVALRMKRIVKK